MIFWLRDFPLPPSVNEYLMPVVNRSRAGARLVKTPIHVTYHSLCEWWGLIHRNQVMLIKDQLLGLKRSQESEKVPFSLRVDCFLAFYRERIFTVNHKCLQLDANNRLKPILDGLVKVLGIDDKHYFGGTCEKLTVPAKELECAYIRIEPMTPRTLQELLPQVRKELGFSSLK